MNIVNPRSFAVWGPVFAFTMMVNTLVVASEITSKAPASLSSFILRFINDHPDLIVAKAQLGSAKAILRASDQAVFNPQLEFEYEETDVTTKSIGIRQTIDWGDQQGSRKAVSKAELHKAEADYAIATQSLISDLLKHLAEKQTKSKLSNLSDETLKLMKEFKDISERRYLAGDLSQVELNLARLAYNQALMEQANMMSDMSAAREKLRALTGSMPDHIPALPELFFEPKLNHNLEVFIQKLPAIRSLLADTQVTKQQVLLRKSETAWNPTIGISAGSEGDESLVGLNLSIPLNIRNNYSAEVDAAQQVFIASEQRTHMAYRDTRANLIATTERYRNLLNAWNNWRDYSGDNVQQQLRLIKKLWRAGDLSASEYLLQLKQALETQATGVELRNQLWLVAFDWMSMTDSIDDWLGINIELLGNS
ncbi:MAG: TolC family protein [Gammaproteobacteria bacterium]|nr:TolC family protein [Gammaproteobacteria bacterium]